MLKFKTKVQLKNLKSNDLILFLEEIWGSHYFSFDVSDDINCYCFKINDNRIKSGYSLISDPQNIIPKIINIENNYYIEYYNNSKEININILKVFSSFKDNTIYINKIEKYIHPLFTINPFDWAIDVIKYSKDKKNSIIKPFQLNLASSILYWRQHILTKNDNVIQVNPTILEDNIVISINDGFIFSKLDIPIKISNTIQIIPPHILIRNKYNEYYIKMLDFWKDKIKIIGEHNYE